MNIIKIKKITEILLNFNQIKKKANLIININNLVQFLTKLREIILVKIKTYLMLLLKKEII